VKRTKAIAASAGTLFWIAVGLLASYGATRLGVGSITDPGAGFIFFWSGLVLIVLSLIVFLPSCYTPSSWKNSGLFLRHLFL
jgi:hypothetical protein